ncbi:hypothetical protein LIER_36837 [Lithospermum erythrorhizon]|uniref:Reverse transcriptase RNase H-like domain-containing protein n=1 Tax=Lithospermum erythrorhizon TaxID=34254 RepID=A0AAV3PBD4_LITER
MPEVDLEVSIHRLYDDPHYTPIKHKKWTFSKENKGHPGEALSSVLVREEKKVPRPVYYVSRVMRGAEMRYRLTERLVYALIVAAGKLKPYFEAYPMEVVTDQPLRKILKTLAGLGGSQMGYSAE